MRSFETEQERTFRNTTRQRPENEVRAYRRDARRDDKENSRGETTEANVRGGGARLTTVVWLSAMAGGGASLAAGGRGLGAGAARGVRAADPRGNR